MHRYMVYAVILLAGCSRSEPEPQAAAIQAPVPLAQARVREVIPVADGGAYVNTSDSGLWYVRGVEAVKVHFNRPDNRPQETEIDRTWGLEIVPTIDGGAYATFSIEKGIWYLREGEANRVREASTIKTQAHPTNTNDRFFALYVAQLKARRAAEDELGAFEEGPPVDDDGREYGY